MGVPTEKYDAALDDLQDAQERAEQHLEWVYEGCPQKEDLAAHALLGIRALILHLREMR